MNTQEKPKFFAFKLATDARKTEEKKANWQVRDGVAMAGCTDPANIGDFRASRRFSRDTGIFC